ncbi:MAG: class I SAM-dependent methyltransferase, partial [Phototrophicaceae bacterium]
MAISETDEFSQADYLAQVTHITKDIVTLDASMVLEIGMGKGFNMYHIKNTLPNIEIYGVDYSKLHLKKSRTKAKGRAVRTDFHYLPFAANTFDYVFEIESICHATDMKQALMSIYQILKPNGTFSIFDGFRIIPSNHLTDTEMKARHLVEKPLGVNEGILIDNFIALASSVGFEVISQN